MTTFSAVLGSEYGCKSSPGMDSLFLILYVLKRWLMLVVHCTILEEYAKESLVDSCYIYNIVGVITLTLGPPFKLRLLATLLSTHYLIPDFRINMKENSCILGLW